ncbi:hypothetical protein HELRODRAFT_181968 [Helobdella robusta]|uniref:PHD-type domain-containing protein n=1 Tax=Helobdella robusta TaxID=6412 RepID=T1FHJ4_HELRO|nr:hypothetical protein HELRODRAFT_181968 [Helobdella robusta]ESN91913.1 hypothetical protein HELRODRAFT_181968 [Helobdella robusta]
MSSGSRYCCTKCTIKVPSKDVLSCTCCKTFVHNKCETNDDILEILKSVKGLKWFCQRCVGLSQDVSSLAKSMDASKNEFVAQLNEINDSNRKIKLDVDSIKMVVDHNQSKLDEHDRFDTVLREEIKIFKNEIKETFSSIVSKEVKLNVEHLTGDVSEKNVIKIMRLGRKCETVVRPILIKLDCVLLRDSIMRNVYKFKSLKEFSHVGLNYDLTKDQRQEFKSFVDKAKVMG